MIGVAVDVGWVGVPVGVAGHSVKVGVARVGGVVGVGLGVTRVGVPVGGIFVSVAVALGVGVIVGGGVEESSHPGMALQTFSRPPVAVFPDKPDTTSTLLRIALLSWATVKLLCPPAERIKAAAPDTWGVAMDVPL